MYRVQFSALDNLLQISGCKMYYTHHIFCIQNSVKTPKTKICIIKKITFRKRIAHFKMHRNFHSALVFISPTFVSAEDKGNPIKIHNRNGNAVRNPGKEKISGFIEKGFHTRKRT